MKELFLSTIVRCKVMVIGICHAPYTHTELSYLRRFLDKSGEYSYAMFTLALIGQHSAQAGNRLIASLKQMSAGAGNKLPYHIDHNSLTSIVSYNLPFIPTTGTLYQSIPRIMLITNLQSSDIISDGERRTRPSKFNRISVWSLMTGWGSSVYLLS